APDAAVASAPARGVARVPFGDGAASGERVRGGRRTRQPAAPATVHCRRKQRGVRARAGQGLGTRSRTTHVSRAVHVRHPASLVMTISAVMVLRPTCRGVATAVTTPDMAAR